MTGRRAIKRGRSDGFTVVELLTVIAIVAVLATLLASAVSGARTRSHQAVCRNNLRQAALAVEMYQDDTNRRPRSFTRLASKPAILPNPRSLICPGDPAVRRRIDAEGRTNEFWGNRANAAQEPIVGRVGSPEEGSWEAELRETTEKVEFSYLHPLAWRRNAWNRLMQGRGNQVGVAACQLHGLHGPAQGRRLFTEFEGQTLRAQRDGSVTARKIFRIRTVPTSGTSNGKPVHTWAPAEGTLMVLLTDDDYPWEFYADTVPATN